MVSGKIQNIHTQYLIYIFRPGGNTKKPVKVQTLALTDFFKNNAVQMKPQPKPYDAKDKPLATEDISIIDILIKGKDIVKTKLDNFVEATKSHAENLIVLSPMLRHVSEDPPQMPNQNYAEMNTNTQNKIPQHNHQDDNYLSNLPSLELLPLLDISNNVVDQNLG